MDATDKKTYLILFIILFFAAIVRINLLGLHRLHMDECLYSNYAMRMVDRGDLLLNGGLQVDKPPLFFYALALSFLINGKSENAARIPNIIFSLLTIFFIFKLAYQIYKNDLISLLSCFFLAFSVMFVLFSTTAFQDISMIMFFVLALTTAYERKFKLTGLFYACSVACKPMTLFLFPIYAYFIFLFVELKPFRKNIKDILIGMHYVFVPLFLWSALAANPRFGIFKFYVTQQPEVMQFKFDIFYFIERFNKWIINLKYSLNNHYYLLISVAGIIVSFIFSYIKKTDEWKSDLFLFISFVYMLVILVIINFRIYDRYLIIFIPFVSIMLARALFVFTHFIKKIYIKNSVVFIFIIPFFIYMHDLPDKGPDMGALATNADGFEKIAEYLKENQGKENQLIYFGHTNGVYGFYYLYNLKYGFGDLKYTFNLNELKNAVDSFKGNSFIVLNARDRSGEEVEWIKRNYILIIDSRDKYKDKEKFLLLKNSNK